MNEWDFENENTSERHREMQQKKKKKVVVVVVQLVVVVKCKEAGIAAVIRTFLL